MVESHSPRIHCGTTRVRRGMPRTGTRIRRAGSRGRRSDSRNEDMCGGGEREREGDMPCANTKDCSMHELAWSQSEGWYNRSLCAATAEASRMQSGPASMESRRKATVLFLFALPLGARKDTSESPCLERSLVCSRNPFPVCDHLREPWFGSRYVDH